MNIIRSLFENRINLISILLDRSNQTYYPGEIITGRLVFSLSEPIDQNSLQLTFSGRVNTLIEDSRHLRTHTHDHSRTRHNPTIISDINNHHTVNENFELFRQFFQFAPEHNSFLYNGMYL